MLNSKNISIGTFETSILNSIPCRNFSRSQEEGGDRKKALRMQCSLHLWLKVKMTTLWFCEFFASNLIFFQHRTLKIKQILGFVINCFFAGILDQITIHVNIASYLSPALQRARKQYVPRIRYLQVRQIPRPS